MLSFESDYTTGAHPKILERMIETNLESASGYGEDRFCAAAKEKIAEACGVKADDIHFLVGGTQTNQLVISSMLAPYEGVIAATTGHVALHEAGAIEYTGHKVLTIPASEGKIDAATLKDYLETYYADGSYDHMVFPGMVYISYPTEYGTLYTRSELEAIGEVCKKYELPLFIDGARLGYGLASHECDITLKDMAKLCDVFYIGGTKVGALCGEAVVFTHGNAPKQFFTQTKQHGALLAKRRLIGIQFEVLFSDDLYMTVSRHAIEMADLLMEVFTEKGYQFYKFSPTNQQFIVLDNATYDSLSKDVCFCFWEKYDDSHTVVRFATSWSTTREDIEALRELL